MIDNTRVFNMNCMDGMKEFPDKYFELAICDPPYGINYAHIASLKKGLNGWKKRETSTWDSYIPTSDYFNELFRVSNNQIIWGGNYFDLGPTRCFIIWDKVQRIDQADCEFAWTSFNYSARIYTYARGNESGFAPKSLDTDKQFANIHPTQKPVSLYKWLLKNYAKEGDKILDSHLGSGSSRIAAFDMGFEFYGYELDKDYFDASEKRFAQHKSQLKLFV